MSKEAVYVRVLGNCQLLDALVIHILQECFILEIYINNRKGYVLSLYRSPGQTLDKFDSFINKFGETCN